MFCSVIIPTIGRSTLARAVESVLSQDCASCEVIVVNDSGQPLPDSERLHFRGVQVITTQRRERSVARNTGAAVARGDYLCFLDDDDWLLPGGLDALRRLAECVPEAGWICGGLRVVDEAGQTLAELNSGLTGNALIQILGGAWAPLPASLVRTSVFFEIGGFVPGFRVDEDIDLCRRAALRTGLANTWMTVACLQRGRGWHSSTKYQHAPFNARLSRDMVLAEPGALRRLWQSGRAAADPAYWYGRLVRIHLSTIHLHLRHRRLFSALSRALSGTLVFLWAGWHVGTSDFWNGVRSEHVPGALHFVMRDYERGRGGVSRRA